MLKKKNDTFLKTQLGCHLSAEVFLGWGEIKMQNRKSGVGILLSRMAARIEATKTPN